MNVEMRGNRMMVMIGSRRPVVTFVVSGIVGVVIVVVVVVVV